MIVAYLTYDTHSLLACSLTCYSWYIAAVLHLHRTLIISTYWRCRNDKFRWPKPFLYMRELGLLPLVTEFQINTHLHTDPDGFSPKFFNCCTLRQFSALSNVQELGIGYLNIHKFMPKIRRYFGHFLPTVRSLALTKPKGSHRQILYFIGLFRHLADLKLLDGVSNSQEGPTIDLTPVPPFSPPLRGLLTMKNFRSVGFLKDMIDLFGGIRFRYMDLLDVDGMRLLLNACVETLEILRLYPGDFRGEEASLDHMQVIADDFSASLSRGDIDLSQHKSLRAIEVMASYLGGRPNFLVYVLSTITSPTFSEVVIFYREYDFHGVGAFPHRPVPHLMLKDKVKEALWYLTRFELFRELHRVRGFRLVLCLDVWDRVMECTVRALKRAVAAEKAKGGFCSPFFEPLLIHNPRRYDPKDTETWFIDTRSNPWVPL